MWNGWFGDELILNNSCHEYHWYLTGKYGSRGLRSSSAGLIIFFRFKKTWDLDNLVLEWPSPNISRNTIKSKDSTSFLMQTVRKKMKKEELVLSMFTRIAKCIENLRLNFTDVFFRSGYFYLRYISTRLFV